MKNHSTLNTTNLLYMAVCTALIIICSFISIPTAIPFTLQLFGIFLSLGILGGQKGTITVIIYTLLGIIGLPVFAGFGSGFSVITSPIGGFIIGFIVLSLVVWMFEVLPFKSRFKTAIAMLTGLLLCYLCGIIWFTLSFKNTGSTPSFKLALITCVLPFIIPDILKLILALSIIKKIRKILKLPTTP